MAKGYIPEAAPIQTWWSKMVKGRIEVVFKNGRDITVLRHGVPRTWNDVTEGICCVYFVTGERHFLAMVSKKKLMKMEGMIEDVEMTNHAKTLLYGMEAAARKMGVDKFYTVDACVGFWYDVNKKDGEAMWSIKKNTPSLLLVFFFSLRVDAFYIFLAPIFMGA